MTQEMVVGITIGVAVSIIVTGVMGIMRQIREDDESRIERLEKKIDQLDFQIIKFLMMINERGNGGNRDDR